MSNKRRNLSRKKNQEITKAENQSGAYGKHVTASAYYSGPLPLPQHFAQYEEIAPGTAAKLVTMCVEEQQHRHTLQRQAMDDERDRRRDMSRLAWGGLIFGTALILALMSASIVLVMLGQAVGGIATLIGALAACGAAIWRQTSKHRQDNK